MGCESAAEEAQAKAREELEKRFTSTGRDLPVQGPGRKWKRDYEEAVAGLTRPLSRPPE